MAKIKKAVKSVSKMMHKMSNGMMMKDKEMRPKVTKSQKKKMGFK